jgi:hypothetical protein
MKKAQIHLIKYLEIPFLPPLRQLASVDSILSVMKL